MSKEENAALVEAYQTFTDLWKFYRRNYEMSFEEGSWPEICKDAARVRANRPTELFTDLLFRVMDYLGKNNANK